ncbi:FlgN protein [Alkalibaculum bacchi]|uniref:FlgN protein n=1 Tax=Alkalibaculum bacchi TaxID=645887 RepID=A0A366IFK9_9FIRM|nr:flagellar export chaperone FlgN [Alkalibaculum bacchi]RBP70126.1 FlgN protein [Alkalibaculum bacchi]
MNSTQELANHLKSILTLLHEEKEALIHNDGNAIAQIVESKKSYIEELSNLKGLDIQDNNKIMAIIEQINELQETNLLLTKQALRFQNNLLESMSKNVQGSTNTYSPKGSYESKNTINLIDQSV